MSRTLVKPGSSVVFVLRTPRTVPIPKISSKRHKASVVEISDEMGMQISKTGQTRHLLRSTTSFDQL